MFIKNLLKITTVCFFAHLVSCPVYAMDGPGSNDVPRFSEMGEKIFHQRFWGNVVTTDQYGLSIPNVPVLHPYNPTGSAVSKQRAYYGVPTYLFAVKQSLSDLGINIKEIDQEDLQMFDHPKMGDSEEIKVIRNLIGIGSKDILTIIDQVDAPWENLDICISVQNFPWKNETVLLRPHYWAFGYQPFSFPHEVSHQKVVKALIFGNNGLTLQGGGDPLTLKNFPISVHTEKTAEKQMVSSPNNMVVTGLTDSKVTYFWSVVEANHKVALTMHWILPDNLINYLNDKSGDGSITSIEHLTNTLYEIYNLPKDLSHLLQHLKRNSPQEKYRNLTTEQEELVLEHAASLILAGAKKSTGPIEKAVDYLLLRSDVSRLFRHLKTNSPQDKYRRLTTEQEELVLENAAALILAGAKRDTGPIEKAVDSILLRSDLSGLLSHLKRNSPQEKYRRLTTEQEELVLENAAAMVLSGAKRDTGPIEKAVDQIFLKSDLAGLLGYLQRNSPQDKYRNLTTDQEEQVLEYATALVLSGAKKDTGPIEKAVNNVLGIS